LVGMVERDVEKNVDVMKKRFSIVGRDQELCQILVAVSKNKHVLLEGPVGVGKTTLALAVANFLNRSVYRVDGDERYTEHKLTGWFDPPRVLSEGYTWEAFIQGPLTQSMLDGGVLFINELNRMPEGAQNVLLPAMDERKIIIPKIGVVEAKPSFVVIATQNPEEFVGTNRLSEALKDRFVWVGLHYQQEDEEEAIVMKETSCCDMELIKLAVKIVRRTRGHQEIRRGSSIRGAIDFIDLLKDQSAVSTPQESVYVNAAITALHNKIEIQARAKKSKEDIIKEIVFCALKETKERRPSELRSEYEGKASSENTSGVFAAMTDGTKFKKASDESVLKHMMNLLAPHDRAISYKSPSQTLGEVADVGLRWPILEAYMSLDENLADAERYRIERIVSRIVALIAASLGEKGTRKHYRKIDSYLPGAEDFDLELTLEETLGKPLSNYEQIAAIHRQPKRLAVSLMLDTSNSMQRSKIITAAIAVAVLAHKLERDYYSVIAFRDEAHILKSTKEPLTMEELVMKILELKTGGLTNIKEGLKKGADELESVKTAGQIGELMGIIVTDGWVTTGGDPREVAGLFPKLNVLQVGIGGGKQESEDLAKDLAKIGHGEYIFIDDFDELPNYIMKVFR